MEDSNCEKRFKYLIVDSGAFIKSAPVHEYAENIYTVKGAVAEIRDKQTLKRLQFLPYTLQMKEPSTEAFKHVSDFSKKTGDFSSLSLVDMQIIALTYQLEKENVGTEHLNEKPMCQVTEKPTINERDLTGFYYPKEKTRKENKEELKDDNVNSNPEEQEGVSEESCEEENEESECSDDEGWITSKNLSQVQNQLNGLALNSTATVACITTDFAVQNVLIQMGLNVISVGGLLIKQTRVFILRCYSCYKTTNNMEKKFCPNCGNNTLKRVGVTVNDDGSKKIHINFKRPLNIRGKKFSLPMPKGGKHAADPVVCEDQPIPHNMMGKKALQKIDALSEDYVAQNSPFALNDVYSRSANLGIRVKNHQWQRRNPNEWTKRTGNKRK